MGHFPELVPVCGEDLRFRHETDIGPVMVHYGEVPCIRLLEFLHHAVHLFIHVHVCRRGLHVIIDEHLVIQVFLEHILADVLERDISLEMLADVHYRKDIPGRIGYGIHELAESGVYLYRSEVGFYVFRRVRTAWSLSCVRSSPFLAIRLV